MQETDSCEVELSDGPPVGRAAWGGAFVLPLALVVAFAGLFAAAVLSLGHVLDIPVPCGGSRGCAAVATHPASKILGVPIAYAGVAAYVVLILILLRSATSSSARIMFFILATIGALASAGLLVYSQLVIEATCIWCVASGGAMGALFFASIVIMRSGDALRNVKPAFTWSLAMITAMGVGMQAGMMQRSANQPPISAALLATVTADDLIDEAKSLGPADAPVTIIMFADPLCPACAAMHRSLRDYQSAHPNAVRLVHRHVMLWQRSGPACAVAEIAAEHGRFWPFIDAVYAGRVPPMGDAYLGMLRGLGIFADDVEARLADVEDPAVQRVWQDQALAERLGITATPVLVVLIDGRPPASANQRTLGRILNSPAVMELLQNAVE